MTHEENESKFYIPCAEPVVKFDLNIKETDEETDVIDDKDNQIEIKVPNINNNISNGNQLTVENPTPISPSETGLADASTDSQPNIPENSFKLRLTSKLRTKRLQAVAVLLIFQLIYNNMKLD